MAEEVRETDAKVLQNAALFHEHVLEPCRPVVLRGLASDWPSVAAGREGAEALLEYMCQFDIGNSVGVFVAPSDLVGKFFYKPGLSGLNFERTMMSFCDALDLIAENSKSAVAPTAYAGSIPLADCLPGFEAENRLSFLPEGKARLWLGNAAHVATHYDCMDNVACVISGHRRFTLFAPEHISNLYIGPIDNTMAGRPVSLATPDGNPKLFPKFEAIKNEALIADLAEGDALYIPKLWWHQVESSSSFNGLVNFWWDAFTPGPDEPYTAMLLAMATIAERPEAERAAWRAYFDHYVFRPNGHPLAHLPAEAHGILGPLRSNYGPIRAAVIQLLRSVTGG